MRTLWTIAASMLLVSTGVTPGLAKVTADEAALLESQLTPLGAIRAGNEAGTIPAWDGGITTPPAGFDPDLHHVDPFADDASLFAITAENVDEYADHLSPGQIAMFRRYPETFRMPVYPSRRSASLPARIYEKAVANATTATLTEDGNGVRNATEAIPFPVPKNGLEAIWNHLLRYRGEVLRRVVGLAAPTAGGDYTMVRLVEHALWAYQQPGATTESIDNKLVYFLQEVTAPPRAAGNIVLVHETLNQTAEPRKAWVYNPGRRRVRRVPNIGYDNPGTASDGQRTADQKDMYNGAPDRYEWTLVGRQELYIPYNTYLLHSSDTAVEDIIQPGHINPDLTRYELHRVWVVEAALKDGTNHIYARRTFYLDEDSWQAAVIDLYDGRGEIWRVSEAHLINFYDVPMIWDTVLTVYDLQNGRYVVDGLDNQDGTYQFDVELSLDQFTPETLRKGGRR